MNIYFLPHLWRLFPLLMYENTRMYVHLSGCSFELHYISNIQWIRSKLQALLLYDRYA